MGEEGNYFGRSQSLTTDGNIVAIGAPFTNHGSVYQAGAVKVYQFNDNNWEQRGQTLCGNATEDQFGWSVSLSANGDILAVGARYSDQNGTWSGSVAVYRYLQSRRMTNLDKNAKMRKSQQETGQWIQMGQTLLGETEYDRFGYSLSINARGNILAVGAPWFRDNDGCIKVFQLKKNSWQPLGDTILTDIGEGHWLGYSVSLSPYNLRIAGGIPNHGMGGHVKIFHFVEDAWVEIRNFTATKSEDDLGKSVSLSAVGDQVAFGSIYMNPGIHYGYMSVYELNQLD